MTNAEILKNLISPFAPIYLEEAESDTYPFVVTSLQSSPTSTKDIINVECSDAIITVVDNDFDQANTIAQGIKGALESARSVTLATYYKSRAQYCSEGIWQIVLRFTMKNIQN